MKTIIVDLFVNGILTIIAMYILILLYQHRQKMKNKIVWYGLIIATILTVNSLLNYSIFLNNIIKEQMDKLSVQCYYKHHDWFFEIQILIFLALTYKYIYKSEKFYDYVNKQSTKPEQQC